MSCQIAQPWVGAEYQHRGLDGKKILIMGESAYKRGEFPEGFDHALHTVALANDAIGYDNGAGYWNKSRFYTRAARIFGFNPHVYEQRSGFWNAVAYANYMPIVLSESRQPLTKEQWETGRANYAATVERVDPEYVIFFSMRMWPRIQKSDEVDLGNANFYARKASVPVKNKKVTVFSFKHPTAMRFRWQDVKTCLDREIFGRTEAGS